MTGTGAEAEGHGFVLQRFAAGLDQLGAQAMGADRSTIRRRWGTPGRWRLGSGWRRCRARRRRESRPPGFARAAGRSCRTACPPAWFDRRRNCRMVCRTSPGRTASRNRPVVAPALGFVYGVLVPAGSSMYFAPAAKYSPFRKPTAICARRWPHSCSKRSTAVRNALGSSAALKSSVFIARLRWVRSWPRRGWPCSSRR